LPEHYYLAALEHIPEDAPLVLVSNNPHRAFLFAQLHLAGRRILHYTPHPDSLVDFYLMARARWQIISNSTYGWWSAFLNREAEGLYVPIAKKWLSYIGRTHADWGVPDIYNERFVQVDF
jgi:hypothetical protein